MGHRRVDGRGRYGNEGRQQPQYRDEPIRREGLQARGAYKEVGVTARRGPKKTRRGPKVQRGPNFKFNFRPRSASHHAQPTYMQCICNSNKIENVQLLILNYKCPSVYALHMQGIYKYLFNIKFKAFKGLYAQYTLGICLAYTTYKLILLSKVLPLYFI